MAATKSASGKERILDAALDLFAARGFENVGVTEIAEAAEVSQPSIHYHFRNKRGLWEASMQRLAERLDATTVVQDNLSKALDPLSALKAACVILLQTSQQSPTLGRIIMAEGQVSSDRLAWLMREVYADSYYRFQELIEACIEAGAIKPYKPHQILMLLHGAAVTYFNMAPLVDAVFGEDVRARKNASAFQELFMDVLFAGLAPAQSETQTNKKGRR